MTKPFDPYLQWLGIRDPERPPSHYRLLGVALYESDADVLINAADRQMSHVRTFQAGKHSAESQKLLNELAAAKVCLLNPEKRLAYDAQLKAAQAAELAARAPPALPRPGVWRRFSVAWIAATLLAATAVVVGGGVVAIVYFGDSRGEPSSEIGTASREATPPVAEPTAPPETESSSEALPEASVEAMQYERRWPRVEPPPEPPPFETPEAEPSPTESIAPNAAKSPAARPKPAKPAGDKRPEAPDADAQAAALKEIRELFKERYANAKDRDQKQEFARLLLRQAGETRDNPAARFVLYGEARDMAAAAGDGKLLVAIITAMGRNYRVDLKAIAADTLVKASKKARDAAGNQSLARLAFEMAKADLKKGESDRAKSLIDASREMARKARDVPTLKQTAAALKDLEELRQLRASFDDAQKTLAKTPEDRPALQVAARYHCLVANDWPRGLPLLLNGAEDELKAAVESELAQAPGSPADMVALGERWLTAARATDEANRYLARVRAIYWYQRALPQLTGLTRSKVEKRLADLSD